jgi:hypothetical protein
MTPKTGNPAEGNAAKSRRMVVVSPSQDASEAPARDASSGDAWALAAGLKATAIDTLMERASQALVACDYFRAAELCERALDKAVASADFERCARAIMPLQEARRQLRHLATDAAHEPAGIIACKALPRDAKHVPAGFVLLEPPLVGIDAGRYRELAQRAKAPTMVLVKEPTTKAGLWPIVGVGKGDPFPIVVRTLLAPPQGVDPKAPLANVIAAAPRHALIAWMRGAQESLGDAAIAKVDPAWPADHRVLDFVELLAAVPDHEKLAQAFAASCREAAIAPRSSQPRRRTIAENKYSF